MSALLNAWEHGYTGMPGEYVPRPELFPASMDFMRGSLRYKKLQRLERHAYTYDLFRRLGAIAGKKFNGSGKTTCVLSIATNKGNQIADFMRWSHHMVKEGISTSFSQGVFSEARSAGYANVLIFDDCAKVIVSKNRPIGSNAVWAVFDLIKYSGALYDMQVKVGY